MGALTRVRGGLRTAVAFLAVALAVASVRPRAEDAFALRDGDRVVFYGDSITEARHYTSFVETYVVTRFPKLDVTFVHSGWSGDSVQGGDGGPIDVRLARDVLAHEPTVLTLMLGMNDGGLHPFETGRFEVYTRGYRHIVDTVRRERPGIRITVLQPSAYDDVTRPHNFEGGYNKVLVRYGAWVRELARAEKLTVADLNAPVVAALTRVHAASPAAAAKLIPDRVHPGPQVTLVMAQALLQAWNAPSIVTEVEIDAARRSATLEVNTRVSDVRAGNGLSWSQADAALPMPVNLEDPLVALVVRSSDLMATLNRQPLRVKGLPPGRYTLRIDEMHAGTFGAESLASGINLAELPTPMARQAAEVHAHTLQHNALHWWAWRQIQVSLAPTPSPELTEALRALDALEAAMVRRQREAAQPRPRRYELRAETSLGASAPVRP
jgi:lysophospholipase L1-like esterase